MKQVAIISPLERALPLDLSSYKFLSPRYGSVAVASHLAANGYETRLFCEHSQGRIDWDYVRGSDYVAFSLLSFCAYKGYDLIRRVRSITRAPVIIGGNHASVQPEECAHHADYVVRNEGEATMLALLKALDRGGDASCVDGISLLGPDGSVVHNPNRTFMEDLDTVTDFSMVEGFGAMTLGRRILDLAGHFVPHVNLPFVMASRGCPYRCKFCFTRREFGGRYRRRDPDIVMEEIERVVSLTRSRAVWFADADFLLNREYAASLLERMAARFGNGVEFIIFCRVSVADDPEIQDLLKRAGVTMLCIGTESTNPKTLTQFDKEINLDELADGFKKLRDAGFKVGTSFIFGGEEDTIQQVEDAVDFALRSGVHAIGLHPLFDFPGQKRLPGGEQSIDDPRFIHNDWRFFNGNFVVFFPKRMRPSELQRAICDGYIRFYRSQRESLYQYRPVFLTVDKYIPYLESEERDLYTSSWELMEERLKDRNPASIKIVPADLGGISIYPYAASVLLNNLMRPAAWRALFRYGVVSRKKYQ